LNSLLLHPEVLTLQIVSLILFGSLSVAAVFAVHIIREWQAKSHTQQQYALEKRSYFVVTLIELSFFVYIAHLLFFIYTINDLSAVIPGAMCAAGVVSANGYGGWLMMVKIVIILLALIWLYVNKEDLHTKGFIYFKPKLYLFLGLYGLFFVDLLLQYSFFAKLTTLTPVLCCSRIYTQADTLFSLSNSLLVTLFMGTFVALFIALWKRRRRSVAALALLFMVLSYFAISYFFSTYIYELPTHKCPYCILQKEYYFIGYFIYTALIIATFYALVSAIFDKQELYRKAELWYLLFMVTVTLKFVYYLLVNHTFL